MGGLRGPPCPLRGATRPPRPRRPLASREPWAGPREATGPFGQLIWFLSRGCEGIEVIGESEHDRTEPVDIQIEMQRSYIDYAMSVIVGRALPDVRDGLKPVHVRILYAMYDGGYRPDRGYSKCSRVVGDVMGQYHPHGDAAIYDALVRLAQPWAMRLPLVDGQGNFGSPGNDPPAAMRYCVTGETRVRTPFGSVSFDELVELHQLGPNAEVDIDLKVLDRNGDPVRATKLFHSGVHPTRRVATREGYELTGTANHPVLCLVDVAGVPTLLWKLLEEISAGDRVALFRGPEDEFGSASLQDVQAATLAGAWVSEGWVGEKRAGFNNVDPEFFADVLAAFDAVVGGPRYVSTRTIASGSSLLELDVHDLRRLRASPLAEVVGRSRDKHVPSFVWRGSRAVKRAFLQALFEGDGSCSLLPRNTIQISYSTRSRRLAADVQRLLLEFGIVARQSVAGSGEHKVYIGNRRDARLFAAIVGFHGRKQQKLQTLLRRVPATSTAMSTDHVPGVARFVRERGGRSWGDRQWLRKHAVDRIERWERDASTLRQRIGNREVLDVVEPLVDGRFYFAEVAEVTDSGVRPVFSLRVDTDDHSFLTDGFVSHNTECRLAPVAMEMLRDIDEETVDFAPNYDQRGSEPAVLPSRFPNLLVNGAAGIAVGMATNIPPHNLREVAEAVQWALANPTASEEELLEACVERIKGPDFPTGALIVGREGIDNALRTGRGSIRMRAVVEVEEDRRGRQQLVVTELPYQVNPDALAEKIAELVREGRVQGIADIKDDSSLR